MQLQPSNDAVRARRSYHRRRQGRAVVLLEIDEIEVTDFLVTSRFLQSTDIEDRAAVSKALSDLIAQIVKERL
jgi:hypothetical protein